MKNIIKYFTIIFIFVFGMFLASSEAKAYMFYYNSKDAVGVSYNTTGYITDVQDQIVIYGQDVKADYTVGYSSNQIRIKKITVKVGSSNETEINGYSVSNLGANQTLSPGYAITSTGGRSATDNIVINLQGVLDSYFSSYYSSNEIKIKIYLEKKGFCLFGCNWNSYSSISYKNSDGTVTDSIILKRTNANLLSSQLQDKSTGELKYQSNNVVNGEIFYNKNSTKSNYYYLVKTNFKLASANAKVNYTDALGNSNVSTSVAYTIYNGYSQASVTNTKFSGMFANDAHTKYTFNSFTLDAKDLYGVSASKTIDNADVSLTIATKIPKIDSVMLSIEEEEEYLYGAVDVFTKFDLSSLDYTNNSYTYTISSVTFNVGSGTVTKTCNNCTGSVLSTTKKIQHDFMIYSNEGTGEITFKNVVATITDKYGNEKSYTATTSLTSSVERTITLLSNSEGAEFKSMYNYYYDGETIHYSITLKGLSGTTIDSISLIDDSNNSYVIYNNQIVKDVEGSKKFDFSSDVISYDNTTTWTGVRLNNFCNAGVCENPVIDAVIYFNYYKTLSTQATVTNASYITVTNIDSTSISVTSSNIGVSNAGNANIKFSTCEYISGDDPFVRCPYTNLGSDGFALVTLERGTFVFASGQKSEKTTVKVIENRSNPTVSVTALSGEETYYNSTTKAYYYKGSKTLTITLSDGYCGNGSFHYSFGGEFEKIDFSCGSNNILSSASSTLTIPLPSEDEIYEFEFYVVSDGITKSEQTYQDKFVPRNTFFLDGAVVKVNDDPFFTTSQDNHFNAISIEIEGVTSHSILSTYRMKFAQDLSYSESNLTIGDNIYNYNSSNRGDLIGLNGTPVGFTITLFDRLGNSKNYTFNVKVDTLAPVNPDPRVATLGSEYVVTISNYNLYDYGDVITILYGENEQSCTKGEDDECKFTINARVYSLEAKDKADNTSESNRYTTEKTNANVTSNHLSIAPFLNEIYSIKDDVTIKAVKYNYTDGEVSDPNSINRACTSVTTYNCYITYRLTSTSMYEASELENSELNVKISALKLDSNYTYVFLVTLGNSSLALENDYDEYPRLDIEYVDNEGPTLIVNSIQHNPSVVSDAQTNEKTYTFEFALKDNNIDSSVGYEYLILNKQHAPSTPPHTLSNTKFNEYLSYCPRNWSSYIDACGQWSNEIVSYSSVSGDTATGIISIAKNGTMKNNTLYLLYVKAYDKNGNFDIITLNEFRNVSTSIEVYYKDGEAGTEVLATTNVIKTTYENAALRIALNSTLASMNVEISSIKLNGVLIDEDHRVGKGVHTLEVSDTLGNSRVVTIYCGALTSPEIKIYNYYDGEYYEIKADTNYAYNAATLEYLYVKVDATNLQNVGIRDEGSDTDTVYESTTDIYKAITNSDGTHPYGMKLSQLLVATSGTVTVSAVNDGGRSSIDLVIDSDKPLIKILSGVITDTDVYLFDESHTVSYNSSAKQYSISEANYRYELNYEYLFRVLNLKIDDQLFDSIKASSSVIVKLDGNRIVNYLTPVATREGGSLVSVEYFDMAGNIAEPLYINLEIVDKQAPEFIDLNLERTVEANEEVFYMEEITSSSDNFDPLGDINIKVYLNGTEIYNGNFAAFKAQKHKFVTVGEYTLKFVLSDSNGNVSDEYVQTVSAIDTKAPTTRDVINLDSMNLGNETVINLPRFVDSDIDESEYYPTIVELYKDSVLVESNYYNLTIESDKVKVTFNQNAKLGVYTILFKVADSYGNVAMISDDFTLTDRTPPQINVYLDGKEVVGDTVTLVYGNGAYELLPEAIDAHDGKLTVTRSGDSINVNKQGSYVITFKAKDKSGVEASRQLTVIVEADTKLPVINKVTIGRTTLIPSNESLPIYNSLNYKYEIIKVEASDNAKVDYIKINYGGAEAGNGSEVMLVDGSITVMVEVADTSGNKVNATYYINVDNSAPVVSGVENYRVYDAALLFNVMDARGNLVKVDVYKGDNLIEEYRANLGTDMFSKELTEVSKYRVVATDAYGNESVYVFEIRQKSSHSIKDSDGNEKEYNNDGTFLSKVEVGENDSLTIYFTKNNLIKDKDQVYILVKYPNSDKMYVAYSTNGAYYNKHEKVVLTGSVIAGMSNSSTLENIGSAQYAYVMVIKSNDGTDDDVDDSKPTNTGMSKGLKDALVILGLSLAAVIVIVVIIKFRRKIRAA